MEKSLNDSAKDAEIKRLRDALYAYDKTTGFRCIECKQRELAAQPADQLTTAEQPPSGKRE